MGCDTMRMRTAASLMRFNPRTHMGCDKPDSIRCSANIGFNSRTHAGCDQFPLTHPMLV